MINQKVLATFDSAYTHMTRNCASSQFMLLFYIYFFLSAAKIMCYKCPDVNKQYNFFTMILKIFQSMHGTELNRLTITTGSSLKNIIQIVQSRITGQLFCAPKLWITLDKKKKYSSPTLNIATIANNTIRHFIHYWFLAFKA